MNADGYRIKLEDVHQSYPDSKTHKPNQVLNDIDLHVAPGEFLSVVGPSGCGKSTLLKLVLGSEMPVSGKVFVDGNLVTGPDKERGIVFQKYGLFPHLTVLENIAIGLEFEEFSLLQHFGRSIISRVKRRELRERAMEYLRLVRLDNNDAKKYPVQLSGGMQQRVAIAQALIKMPRVLMMDEPFGALDGSTRQDMQVLILELWKKYGMTIFFVTHDLEEALYVGRRVIGLTRFYSTDAGDGIQLGAKIVFDVEVSKEHPKPTDWKYSSHCQELLEHIRRDVLDPKYHQHIRDFDLTHRDAYRTVDPAEWNQASKPGEKEEPHDPQK